MSSRNIWNRGNSAYLKMVATLCAVVILWNFGHVAGAQGPPPHYWQNANGGDYLAPANWAPATIPQIFDSVIFDLRSEQGYVVTTSSFMYGPETFAVKNDKITLNLPHSWINLNDYSSLRVGGGFGDLARLSVADGFIEFNDLRVGHNGGRGLIELIGPAAMLTILDPGFASQVFGLHVGQRGDGAVQLRDGGRFTVAAESPGAFLPRIYVGYGTGGIGAIDVEGHGSRLTADGMTVGQSARGSMSVADQGDVQLNDVLYVGDGPATYTHTANGRIEIEGQGSEVVVARQAQFGRNGGYGSLVITNGGRLETHIGNSTTGTSGIIATLNTPTNRSRGDVFITGAGSRWDNDGLLVVGLQGDANVRLRDQGQINSLRGHVGRNVNSSGIVQVSQFSQWNVGQDLNLGGTEAAQGGSASVMASIGGKVAVGTTLRLWPESAVDVAASGAVVVGLPIASAAFGTVKVGGSGTLVGSGSITGDVLVQDGLLSPGSSLGTLSIDGNLNVASAGRILFEIGGTLPGVNYDQIYHTGLAAISGTIQLTLANGYVPQVGDMFDLFSGPGAVDGSGATYQLPPGITLQSIALGQMVVASVPEPATLAMAGVSVLWITALNRRRSSAACRSRFPHWLVRACVVSVLTGIRGHVAHSATFKGIPGLFEATAISADGKYVAGVGFNAEFGALASRWEELEGLVNITSGIPFAISLDGRTMLVTPPTPSEGTLGTQVARGRGPFPPTVIIGGGTSDNGEYLNALTDDGLTLIGGSADGPRSYDTLDLFGHSGRSGTALAGNGKARAVSGDGRFVLTGGAVYDNGSPVTLYPGVLGVADDLSPNAQQLSGTLLGNPIIYDIGSGVQRTFDGPGQILDLADNGRAVGRTIGGASGRALLYDPWLPAPVDLKSHLGQRFGLTDSLEGWTLTAATAVSADGRTIVGNGVNPAGEGQAWIATTKQKVILAWGHDVPRLIVPVSGWWDNKVYYDDEPGSMPAYTGAIDTQAVLNRVQQQFFQSGITEIEIVNGNPQPGATIVYFANPLGNLLGKAYTGIDRFNQRADDQIAVMVQPNGIPSLGDVIELTAETIVHEIGHSLGLRHIDPPGSVEVMDYDFSPGELELFSSQPHYVKEPPDSTGANEWYDHNPRYHLARYVEGHSPADLAGFNLVAGTWDDPSISLSDLDSSFLFDLRAGGSTAATVLYDAYVLASYGDVDTSRVLSHFEQITLAELSALTFRIAQEESLGLFASSAPGLAPDVALSQVNPTTAGIFVEPALGQVSAILEIANPDGSNRRVLADVGLTASFALPGDFNDDGVVDRNDLTMWHLGFGMHSGARHRQGDANGDERVDGTDLLIWQRELGLSLAESHPGSTAVPEPSSLFVTSLCALSAVSMRRRKKS